jgi:hypothetical protein
MLKIKPNLDIQWIRRNTLKNVRTHRKNDITISGHYKLIKALAVYALLGESKCIAYHQDADGRFADVYNTLISEFHSLSEKGFRCLAIVPKEVIESWLLADENAFPSVPNKPKLPPKPEEIWGQRNDPNSNHPYNYFVRVLEQFDMHDNRDTYAQITENTDIEVLKYRCPESFGQFYADMQSFIPHEAGTP